MVNLNWRIMDDVQDFTVPDEALDFDRSKRVSGDDLEDSYISVETDLDGNANIVVNNQSG